MQKSRLAAGKSFSFFIALVFILLGLAPLARVQAQLPDEVAKMAGGMTLTTALLDSLDKFAKTVGSDAEVRAEMEASSKDASITPDKFGEVINAKYPKLAAAFKSAGLSPDDYIKASLALAGTAGAVELSNAGMDTGSDKAVQANITFFKANKDRCTATMTSLETLEKASK
ncbi:MAG: hypothetical protein QOH88_1449 [Verrucomicrobiota bacterium]|jgi:hypothetical protein